MTKILIAEDEDVLRNELVKVLNAPDRDITVTASASEAVTAIASSDYDLVVTDLVMESRSEVDGLRVVRAAKDRNLYSQVIVVTSYGNATSAVESMRLGAFTYLDRNEASFRKELQEQAVAALTYRTSKSPDAPRERGDS